MQTTITIRASSLPRLESCPGSHWAQFGLPETTSDAAESGTRIHAAIHESIESICAGKPPVCDGLSTREASVAEWMAREIQSMIADHGAAVEIHSESGCSTGIPGVEVLGHYDLLLALEDGSWHLFEFKTGQGSQPDAGNHLQAQAYAYMARRGQPVTVHILAAGNDQDSRHTMCHYAEEDMAAVQNRIERVLARLRDNDRSRHPSPDACRYCRAAGTSACYESQEVACGLARRMESMPDPVGAFVGLSPAERGRTLARLAFAADLIDRIREEARRLMDEEPGCVDGWRIGRPVNVREFSDTAKAFDILADELGIPPDVIRSGVKIKVSVADAVDLAATKLAARTGQPKAVCKRIVENALAPAIEVKTRRGNLERVKHASQDWSG